MAYLGYKYKDQLSILASRLTLLLNKEIKLNFFDTVRVTVKGQDEWIEGFTFTTNGAQHIEDSKYEELIKDLDCLYLNKSNTTKEEKCFIISSKPEIVQQWYDDRREGIIANQIIRKFGTDSNVWDANRAEINEMKLGKNIPKYSASKQ